MSAAMPSQRRATAVPGRPAGRLAAPLLVLAALLGLAVTSPAVAQSPFTLDGAAPQPAAPAPSPGGGIELVPRAADRGTDPASAGRMAPRSAAPAPAPGRTLTAPAGGGVPPFDMGIVPDTALVPSVQSGGTPAPSAGPSLTGPAVAEPAPAPPALDRAGVDRPILPRPDLRLTGETDYWAGDVYLSAAEAQRPTTISIGFVNAVLVMPEGSRLRVSVNGRPVIEVPIDASDRPRQYDARVPPEALRAGDNKVRIEVQQRHRVDCSINATFELWTQLLPEMTGFSFEGGAVPVSGVADLPSIGVDATGATRIAVVTAGLSGPRRTSWTLAAVQAATVLGRFEHAVVEPARAGERLTPGPGLMRLIVGTTADVRRVTEIGAGEAASRPVLTLLPDPVDQVPTLVVVAPTEQEVDRALARFIVQANRGAERSATGVGRWRAPDLPLLTGGETLSLGELGVRTEEFSGRRFQTHFAISLPADFYAAAYGEAQLLLDAAFAPEVKPGSSIDVYVNSALAVNYTYTSRVGDVFRQRPIKVPLTSFRPGPNLISIEANLDTETDGTCLPGTTMPGRDRFVLFNTSAFRMPVFARLGALPNLAGFAAGALPYDDPGASPMSIVVAGESANSLGAAATLFARLAASAGTPLPGRVVSSPAEAEGRSAIMIGTTADLGPRLFEQAGLSDVLRSAWGVVRPDGDADPAGREQDPYGDVLAQLRAARSGAADGSPTPAPTPAVPVPPTVFDSGSRDNQQIYERWRTDVGGGGVLDAFSRLVDWVRSTFGLTLDMLNFPSNDGIVRLPPRTTAVIAQSEAPDGGTWTIVTAAAAADLRRGVEGMAAPQTWNTMSGALAGFQSSSGILVSFPATDRYYVQTVPFSFANLRLVAANWFSLNIVDYALALILASAGLGVITWSLVRNTGRNEKK